MNYKLKVCDVFLPTNLRTASKEFHIVFSVHEICIRLRLSACYISDTTQQISVKFGFGGYTLKIVM
jgi:hypothetical protein